MDAIKSIDWNAFRSLLLGSSSSAYAVQYGILALYTLFMIYTIIRRNRVRVIVLSHTRIWVETLLACAVTFGFYRLTLWLAPKSNWAFFLFLLGIIFVASLIVRITLQTLIYMIDRERALKDLGRGPEVPFNCNWPLIPRCANFCFQQVIFIVLIWSRVG